MARLPFDPQKTAAVRKARETAPSDGADQPIQVSALARRIEDAVRSGVPGTVRVIGEVGSARQRTHWYFTLRDEHAAIDCVLWASAAKRVSVIPTPGQRLVVTGKVEYYPPQGRVTLIADSLSVAGEGDLDRKLRELVEEARSLGWLDPARKRALPAFPRTIAVITSRTGAALQDVLDTCKRRCPLVGIAVIDALVQGDRAAGDVAGAIEWVSRGAASRGIDAVLITRGGGSKEDLWSFNDRRIAEAIVKCPVPVVAAIGHETDTTLAELVADERAATPTQAAMRLTPDRADLERQIGSLAARLGSAVRGRSQTGRQRVEALARRTVFVRPIDAIATPRRLDTDRARRALVAAAHTRLRLARRRLDRAAFLIERHRPAETNARRRASLAVVAERLRDAVRARIQRDRLDRAARALGMVTKRDLAERVSTLNSLGRELDAVGPAAVLRRGYTVTLDASGKVVRSAGELALGQRLRTRFADGAVESEVKTGADGATLPDAPPPRIRSVRRRKPGSATDADQMDLFGRKG